MLAGAAAAEAVLGGSASGQEVPRFPRFWGLSVGADSELLTGK